MGTGEKAAVKRKGKPRGIRRDRDCQSCKDRGIKCDLNRPRCQPCVQSGLPCGGYPQRVVWATETASRQRRPSETLRSSTSRTATQSKESPTISHPKSATSISPSSPGDSAAAAATVETATEVARSQYPANHQYSFIKRLTEFYEQIKVAEHQSGGSYLSPEAIDLVSRIWDFVRARMQGYVAVGSPEQSSMDAVRFHVAALMGLAEAVDKAHPVALFGIATFAFFEVCDGSFGEWQRHLKGARSLLDIHCRSKADLDQLSRDISGLTHIVAHLVWFDTMGAIIRGSRGLIFDDWHRETLMDGFFASVGCPPDTFRLFVALTKTEASLDGLDLSFEAVDQLLRAEPEENSSVADLTAGAWRCTAAMAILSRIGEASSPSRQRALSSAVDQACRAISSIPPTSGIYIHLAATAYLAGINATHTQQCEIVRNYWRNCQASDFPHYPDGQARCEDKWRADGLATLLAVLHGAAPLGGRGGPATVPSGWVGCRFGKATYPGACPNQPAAHQRGSQSGRVQNVEFLRALACSVRHHFAITRYLLSDLHRDPLVITPSLSLSTTRQLRRADSLPPPDLPLLAFNLFFQLVHRAIDPGLFQTFRTWIRSNLIKTPAMSAAASYQDRARSKRSAQASLIPPEWRLGSIPSVEDAPDAVAYIRSSSNKLLSPRELAITETSDVNILLRELASQQLSSLEVTKAFAKRAALLHQLTTCCTEIFFEDAFARAAQLDEHLQRTGETVGPLHGLPVSVKDLFGVEGVDTCIGWVGLTNKPAMQDGNAAAALRRLGAVLYVKTNVPQSMMMSDSYNHVFGQCVSSLNRNLISGGSSGGESTLVSGRGSILGIGTDIGGSIRIPANLTGLYGLSPSTGRQPYERNGPRQDIIRSVAGPMSRSLTTVEKYMEALPAAKPWEIDPHVIPMPWRSELCTTTKTLKIGYLVDDGVIKVQPPVARAVREVVDALRAAGHQVFEWDASTHGHAYKLWETAILADGGEGCRRLCELSGEPLVEGMLVGKPENILTTAETHQLNADKHAYETEYLRRWASSETDALIMPIMPWVGYKPWTWVKSHQYVGYSSIWNLLDYPALAMPVTTADRQKDRPDEEWKSHRPRNKGDEFNHQQYDINLVQGMPVGVQVVTPKLQEEKCIAVAKVIDEALSLQHGESKL